MADNDAPSLLIDLHVFMFALVIMCEAAGGCFACPLAASESRFREEAEDPGAEKILEKALNEPLQIKHSLGGVILSGPFHQNHFQEPPTLHSLLSPHYSHVRENWVF